MQITHTTNKDTGVFWSGNGPEGGPTVTLGFGNSMFNYLGTLDAASSFSNLFTGAVGVAGALNAQAAARTLPEPQRRQADAARPSSS